MAQCEEHPLDVPIIEKRIGDRITFHSLIIIIAAVSTAISCFVSLYLVLRHMTNYTKPKHQKHIIRILLMIPVYSILCTLSIVYYKEHIYLGAIYEFYESLVLASFFLLLCNLLRDDIASLKRVFLSLVPLPWIWPIRIWQMLFHCCKGGRKRRTDGLKWFHLIWAAIFQFCFVKFFGALMKMITEAADIYCEESESKARHAKAYISAVELVSLVICMTFLIQFYKQIKVALKEHNPLLKFIAIKLVIFLFYVQSFIISTAISEHGGSRPSPYISYPSLAVGVPNVILCIEMIGIAIMHIWAYSWKPYKYNPSGQKPNAESTSSNGMPDTTGACKYGAGRALLDVINMSDIVLAFCKGIYWLVHTRKIKNQIILEQQQKRPPGAGLDEHAIGWKTEDLGEALHAEARTNSLGQ